MLKLLVVLLNLSLLVNSSLSQDIAYKIQEIELNEADQYQLISCDKINIVKYNKETLSILDLAIKEKIIKTFKDSNNLSIYTNNEAIVAINNINKHTKDIYVYIYDKAVKDFVLDTLYSFTSPYDVVNVIIDNNTKEPVLLEVDFQSEDIIKYFLNYTIRDRRYQISSQQSSNGRLEIPLVVLGEKNFFVKRTEYKIYEFNNDGLKLREIEYDSLIISPYTEEEILNTPLPIRYHLTAGIDFPSEIISISQSEDRFYILRDRRNEHNDYLYLDIFNQINEFLFRKKIGLQNNIKVIDAIVCRNQVYLIGEEDMNFKLFIYEI